MCPTAPPRRRRHRHRHRHPLFFPGGLCLWGGRHSVLLGLDLNLWVGL